MTGRIDEFFNTDVDLSWLQVRLPVGGRVEKFLDFAYFTAVINGAALLVAFCVACLAFGRLDLIAGTDFGAFALRLLAVSIPVWCVKFGLWYRANIGTRPTRRPARPSPPPPNTSAPSPLWDDWLDGPT